MPAGKESDRDRILSDVKQFEENVKLIGAGGDKSGVLELAKQYASDALFFLKKGDLFTSWGCMNYAHGLLDALRKQQGKI